MTPESIEVGKKLRAVSLRLKEAERLYSELEGSRKPIWSQLKGQIEGSNAAKEDYAYAHPEYLAVIKAISAALSERNYLQREYEIDTLKWHALKREEDRDMSEQRRGA